MTPDKAHPQKGALFECNDCKDIIGCMCTLASNGDDESRPKYCPYNIIEGNKTPWKFRDSRPTHTSAEQRIERVIKELEAMKADAKTRSVRAHEIEDGKWVGCNLTSAPDAELKVLSKAIALLRGEKE